jgi:small subunit ribosomal protein S8
MNLNDPVADLLARLRNGVERSHRRIAAPHSNMKEGILRVLKQEGFLEDYQIVDDPKMGKVRRTIFAYPKTGPDQEQVLQGLVRVSKPGRRVFVSVDKIPKVLDGLGVAILSTSRGIMSDRDARKQKVGGELLCKVW